MALIMTLRVSMRLPGVVDDAAAFGNPSRVMFSNIMDSVPFLPNLIEMIR